MERAKLLWNTRAGPSGPARMLMIALPAAFLVLKATARPGRLLRVTRAKKHAAERRS
jgi:hypothetical protein